MKRITVCLSEAAPERTAVWHRFWKAGVLQMLSDQTGPFILSKLCVTLFARTPSSRCQPSAAISAHCWWSREKGKWGVTERCQRPTRRAAMQLLTLNLNMHRQNCALLIWKYFHLSKKSLIKNIIHKALCSCSSAQLYNTLLSSGFWLLHEQLSTYFSTECGVRLSSCVNALHHYWGDLESLYQYVASGNHGDIKRFEPKMPNK